MERGSRKRSSSARSEKMEIVGDRYGKMERYCATGQSPQRAIPPMEEEVFGNNVYYTRGQTRKFAYSAFIH